MKKYILSFFVCVLLINCAETNQKAKGIDVSLMDLSVKPQDDFFRYVNGTWLKNTEIPDDKTRWGSFDQLREKTRKDVLSLLKEAVASETLDYSTEEGKAIKLFKLITDIEKRNAEGLSPIQPFLKEIDEIASIEDIEKYLIKNEPYGGGGLLGFYVSSDNKDSNKNSPHLYPGSIGIERDYYLKDDEDSKKIKGKYEAHVARMFKFLSVNEKQAKEIASKVVAMETQLAAARMDKVERRYPVKRYNPKTIAELERMTSSVNWTNYFEGIGIKDLDYVIVTDLGYFNNMNKLLKENSIEDWKHYLKWTLLDGAAGKLTMEMDKANWEFYGRDLRGALKQEPLEKRALRTVNRTLGEPLGKIYVAKKFPPQAKEQMEELVDNLMKAYITRINALEWMDKETKKKAIEKIEKTVVKVGYPDKWKDYSKLTLAQSNSEESYFNAISNISKFEFDKSIEDLKKPVDKTEWFMSPQTVNAYYNPSYNEIVFPAAILQAPFFDFEADAAVNYGGIGAVIGHEISHGFDDSGADYDANGNLENWWTEKDLEKFNGLGEKLADQFSAIEVLPSIHINGKFTLGENIGDLGGINAAYDALQLYFKDHEKPAEIDGFSPEKRFFLSWGTIWRTKMRDEALKNQVRTDPHSPGENRATQPLKNVDVFYSVFDVKEGDKMYLAPEERVYIW